MIVKCPITKKRYWREDFTAYHEDDCPFCKEKKRMNQTIEEYDDVEFIKKETFKRITKKMVKELIDSQEKQFQVKKIESPEDLNQLIEEL